MASRTNPPRREHDIVVYGATGFVGRLLVDHLAAHAPDGARIALGGRSRERLERLRESLTGTARDWPVVVADAADPDELGALARSTRVIATTVGPYARYGLPLATACAEAGTHYADLTGEVLYVRDVIDACHETATRTGARLVTACGFDSVPSDLGVLMLHRQAQADGAGGLGDTTLLVTRMRGGVSGGTVDSMRAQLEALDADPSRRRTVLDPFALSPDRSAEGDDSAEGDVVRPSRDDLTGQWTAPFVMAPFNTRIVRRSNALLAHAYGPRFRYREAMGFGTDLRARATALAVTVGLGVAMAAMSNPLTRPLADRVAPAPGQGPDEQARANGRFRMEVRTVTDTGRRYVAVVAARGDPGYAATAVMLGESALCLAFDEGEQHEGEPHGGGVLTPAVAMGGALVDRLRAQGFTMTADPE
ncbi:saccharopine dehydrogenase family protein [Lapillicoccus sp.]|uniref:saccharopine dehydrogenase family protein n=1 Tax=Lapillicoccus sp. TaxID=1909287 RepID=UPI003982E3B4